MEQMGKREIREELKEEMRKIGSKQLKLIAGLMAGVLVIIVVYIFWDEANLFFQEYFWDPIVEDSGYNLYNTFTYFLILLAVILLTPSGLKKIGVSGRDVAFGALPFILIGSFFRVFEDMSLLEEPSLKLFFISPFIYLIVGIPLVASLFLGRALKRVRITMLAFGTAILISLVVILALNFPEEVNSTSAKILLLPGAWLIVAIPFMAFKPLKLDWLSVLILFGQLLDGSATLFGLTLGYGEKHHLSEALIGVDPYLFFLVKVLVAVLLIYLLDTTEMDDDFKNVFKFAIIMLGLAPGARDALRIFLVT